jgi:predicted TIM-barrel fold metal-dependent hydrolase
MKQIKLDRSRFAFAVSRRTFLKTAAFFTGTLLFLPQHLIQAEAAVFPAEIITKRKYQLNAYRETLKNSLKRVGLPIIDVEHHWGGKLPLKELIEKMDRNGVAMTWLGANERNGNPSSIEACSQFPNRLVPTTIHGDGPRWHGKDLSLVQELKQDVRSGEYFAMGEFEARHYISSTNDRNIHMPLDSDSFHGVFKLSEETGLPFALHHEAEDALLPELEKMLTLYPRATVIWCHVGRNRDPKKWTAFPSPAGVRNFLQKYPNLYFDIVQGGPGNVFLPTGARESILYEEADGPPRLKGEWMQLFNVFADRFVIGSDVNTGRWDSYDKVMSRLRSAVLGVLEPAAAEKIAFKNAWYLMCGEVWQ